MKHTTIILLLENDLFGLFVSKKTAKIVKNKHFYYTLEK